MTDNEGCSSNTGEIKLEDNDADEVKVDECSEKAYEAVKENCVDKFLKESRKFEPRKRRSCHRRSLPMTDKERKEENKRHSRNYIKRNRDEIEYYRAQLKSDKVLRDEKYRFIKMLLGTKLEEDVRTTIGIAENILKSILGEGEISKEETDRCFLSYNQVKKGIQALTWPTVDYTLQKEFDDLKEDLQQLIYNKRDYITTKGRTNFASTKCRLQQKVIRAKLKLDYSASRRDFENCLQIIDMLQSCDNALKAIIWSKFLSPIDEYYDTSVAYDKFGIDYTNWKILRQFYHENPNHIPDAFEENGEGSSNSWDNAEGEENRSDSTDSQILNAIQNIELEWSGDLEPWVDPNASVVNTDMTASTSASSSTSKMIKVEGLSDIDDTDEALRALFNEDDYLPPSEVSEEQLLQNIIAYSRKRRSLP